MKKNILFLLIVFSSCSKKEETPAPGSVVSTPVASTLGCRVSVIEGDDFTSTYQYNKDGFMISSFLVSKRGDSNTIDFIYENGLLTGVKEAGFQIEAYEYINGALSKMKVILTNEEAYKNYTINITCDDSKRIIKMVDAFGYQSVLKRDSKGNLVEMILTKKDNSEVYRMVRSDFDNKKTAQELFKGWQFDVEQYYGLYMKNPLFTVGASGNATKVQIYENTVLSADWEYTFEYNSDGYPTQRRSFNKISKETLSFNYTYKDCK